MTIIRHARSMNNKYSNCDDREVTIQETLTEGNPIPDQVTVTQMTPGVHT